MKQPTIMKKYTDLTQSEKLALDDDSFAKAVKIEAIDRGIKLPLTLDEAIRRTEFVGFVMPKETVTLYEIVRPGKYSSPKPSGIAFLSEESAKAALTGMVSLEEEGYGATAKQVIVEGEFRIQQTFISLSNGKNLRTGIEEYFQDDKDFDAVCKECSDDLSIIRQGEYNRKVDEQKRREYLALANGDESIAQAFWAKTERREWPRELTA